MSSKKEFQASLERYSVSDNKFEADKNSRSNIGAKKLDGGAKLKTDNRKLIETMQDIDGSDRMITKGQITPSKTHSEVTQEATVAELQARISEKLNTCKNITIPKEPGVDPLLVS